MPAPITATCFPFTDARIRSWPTPKVGRVRLRDAKCPGLCCYVTCAGSKKFYYRNRQGEIPNDTPFPTLSVEAARNWARKKVAPDPIRAAAARRTIKTETTLSDLWEWFQMHHLPHLRSSTTRRYLDSWRLHLEPRLGNKRLSAIKRSDVQAMADAIIQTGERNAAKGKRKAGGNGAGRHACSVLSAMFHAAAKDEAMRYAGDIPTIGIRRPKVASRARFLQPGELPAFFAALDEEPPLWRLFWTCCLFVGLRRGNVASARWSEMALDLGQWLVPEERSKTGTRLAVPIPAPVLSQLIAWKAELPELLQDANADRQRLLQRRDAGVRVRLPVLSDIELAEAAQYVFPSALVPGKPSESLHIVDPKASWRRILLRAKLENLRPHDLRRSIGSWMALGGVGLPIIGAALGHKDQRSTQVYARLNDSAVRAAMNNATDAMIAAGSEVKAGSTLPGKMSDKSDKDSHGTSLGHEVPSKLDTTGVRHAD